ARGSLKRALRQPHRLRSNPDAPSIECFERDSKALPFFAQTVFNRHPAIRQHDFHRRRKMHAHLFFVAAHSKAWKRALDKKRCNAARPRRRVRLRKYDVDAGNIAVRNPNLRAIKNVVIAVKPRPGLNSSGIRAGLWLCEAERSD